MMSGYVISYEHIRRTIKGLNKLELRAALLGKLVAEQELREIGRLHTYYSGHRTEYDYTKFGVFLFPNEHWNYPVLYHDGLGIDHHSTVIKGACLTQSPAARDTIRLLKNCILPKSLTLPESAQKYAQDWDVFGIERVAAIDNGTELVADAVIFAFMACGICLLRMPPWSGDLKGTIERTHMTVETQFVEGLAGYVARQEKGMNPKYDRLRKKAELAAKHTVEEYTLMRTEYIQEFNNSPHPRLPVSRIQVWRNGLEQAPPILITGLTQIKCTFALTYTATLTREGVIAEKLKYNSPELAQAYRHYSGKVFVKVDPDDIRTVLVLLPENDTPIQAKCTTFEFPYAMPQELWAAVEKRIEVDYPMAFERGEVSFVMPEVFNKLQSSSEPSTPKTTPRKDIQAVTQAAALPQAKPAAPTGPPESLKTLLAAEDIPDD